MHDSSEADVQGDEGFVIPAQHARRARIRQRKLEGQSDFRFKQPSAPRHKHGTAEAVLLSKAWQKGKPPSEKFGASKAAQGTKTEAAPWGTFLASLQASKLPEEPSSEDITENWAGTVFWNDVWEKSVEAEAEMLKKSKQAVFAAAHTDGVTASEAAALPAADPGARRSHAHQGPRVAPGPLNKGLLRNGV